MYRSAFKNQVEQAAGKFNDPLGRAMVEWYRKLPDEQQLVVEDMAQEIISKVKGRNPDVQMGVMGALSLIGALVAVQEGWVRHGQE